MDQLIAKDGVGPMIVVMPSIDPHHGLQDCVDAPGASETALREVGFDIIKNRQPSFLLDRSVRDDLLHARHHVTAGAFAGCRGCRRRSRDHVGDHGLPGRAHDQKIGCRRRIVEP